MIIISFFILVENTVDGFIMIQLVFLTMSQLPCIVMLNMFSHFKKTTKNCNCSQDFYPNSYNTTENSPEWTSSLEPRAWLGDLSKWHWHCQPALLLISPLLKSNNVPGLWSCKCETPYSWKTKHKQKNNNTQLS